MKAYAERFVALAKQLAEKAEPKRRQELLEIARICSKEHMSQHQPFAEAVQSVWFIQCILQIVVQRTFTLLWTLDQYMYPYVKADLEAGRERQK